MAVADNSNIRSVKATSSKGVKDALKEVERFYAAGCASLKEFPGRMGYGGMKSEAERLGYNPETLRKARAFAENYTEEQLDALCGLAGKHGFPLAVSHVVRLQSVHPKHRTTLQKQMIEGKWSKRELDGEIRKRFGNRMPTAGRRRRTLPSVADAEYAIAQICNQWQRVLMSLREPAGERDENDQPLRKDLSPAVRDRIQLAETAMSELGKLVNRRLDQKVLD